MIGKDRLDRFEKLAERFVGAVEKYADSHAKQVEHGIAVGAAAQQMLGALSNRAKLFESLMPKDPTEEPPQQ
jgi:hypothetical protein